jgi:gas vesicle protein
MLRGLRTALKYFTLGLLAGLLLAPRKGDQTRALLVDRGKEYIQELMSSGQQAAADLGQKASDAAHDALKTEGRGYDSSSASNVQ